MQPPESKAEKSHGLSWLHFPKTHFLATSALTVGLITLLSVWPSENAEAIRQAELPSDQQINNETTAETESLDSSVENTPSQILTSRVREMSVASIDESTLIELTQTTEVEVLPATAITKNWHEEVVKSGDNLSNIFKRAKLTDRDVYLFVSSSKEAKALTKLQPGEKLEFLIEGESLSAVRYKPNRLDTLIFNREENTYIYEKHSTQPDIQLAFKEANITDSLFLAGTKAGLEDSVIMETANIFGWDIDFVLDIRRGDSFKVLYEEKFLDGEKFGNGSILAAEFINQGKTYRAVRYTNASGDNQYYTPDGDSMRKEFLRTPVDFARISSHFNLRRKHPVLNTIRAHKGTDYAAPRGTPIKAVGDGKVVHAGRKGGYGNVVIIKHGQTYKTLYAHLHKFRRGIRVGTTVKQGQTIGYVGSTGLATGPHLHYEFHVNGAVRNPVTVKLPKAKSIPSSEMLRFAQQTQPVLAKLGVHTNTQLALKENQ